MSDDRDRASPRIALVAAAYRDFDAPSLSACPMPQLSEEEWRHVNRFSQVEQRHARYMGRRLLHAALTYLGHKNPVMNLKRGQYGQPCMPDSDLTVSLSYCPGIAVAAAGKLCRVGVDVEAETDIHFKDIQRALSPRERERVEDQKLPAPLVECWTVKESVLKAAGCGFSGAGALRDDLFTLTPVLDGAPWQIARYHLDFLDIQRSCALSLAYDDANSEIIWLSECAGSELEKCVHLGLTLPSSVAVL